MSSKLADFLINISKSPEALSNFQNNRNAAMDAAGLSSAEKAVLESGNANVIRTALAEDAGRVRGAFTITLEI